MEVEVEVVNEGEVRVRESGSKRKTFGKENEIEVRIWNEILSDSEVRFEGW